MDRNSLRAASAHARLGASSMTSTLGSLKSTTLGSLTTSRHSKTSALGGRSIMESVQAEAFDKRDFLAKEMSFINEGRENAFQFGNSSASFDEESQMGASSCSTNTIDYRASGIMMNQDPSFARRKLSRAKAFRKAIKKSKYKKKAQGLVTNRVTKSLRQYKRLKKYFAHHRHELRGPLFFGLWLAWLIGGTIFYGWAPNSNLGLWLGFYQALNIGYSIGFGFPTEDNNDYLFFSTVYVLMGASFVGAALGFFADKVSKDNEDWFTRLEQRKEVEDAMKASLHYGRLRAWIHHYSAAVRALAIWLLFVVAMMVYSMYLIKWSLREALYFAVSSLSTGGHWKIPDDSPDYLFGLTGGFIAVGVPMMAVAMAQIAYVLIINVDVDEAKATIDAVVTKEEIEYLHELGMEEFDGTIDRAEFIILCMVRIGTDPGLISYINQRFLELGFYTGEPLRVSEITQNQHQFFGGEVRRRLSIQGSSLKTYTEYEAVTMSLREDDSSLKSEALASTGRRRSSIRSSMNRRGSGFSQSFRELQEFAATMDDSSSSNNENVEVVEESFIRRRASSINLATSLCSINESMNEDATDTEIDASGLTIGRSKKSLNSQSSKAEDISNGDMDSSDHTFHRSGKRLQFRLSEEDSNRDSSSSASFARDEATFAIIEKEAEPKAPPKESSFLKRLIEKFHTTVDDEDKHCSTTPSTSTTSGNNDDSGNQELFLDEPEAVEQKAEKSSIFNPLRMLVDNLDEERAVAGSIMGKTNTTEYSSVSNTAIPNNGNEETKDANHKVNQPEQYPIYLLSSKNRLQSGDCSQPSNIFDVPPTIGTDVDEETNGAKHRFNHRPQYSMSLLSSKNQRQASDDSKPNSLLQVLPLKSNDGNAQTKEAKRKFNQSDQHPMNHLSSKNRGQLCGDSQPSRLSQGSPPKSYSRFLWSSSNDQESKDHDIPPRIHTTYNETVIIQSPYLPTSAQPRVGGGNSETANSHSFQMTAVPGMTSRKLSNASCNNPNRTSPQDTIECTSPPTLPMYACSTTSAGLQEQHPLRPHSSKSQAQASSSVEHHSLSKVKTSKSYSQFLSSSAKDQEFKDGTPPGACATYNETLFIQSPFLPSPAPNQHKSPTSIFISHRSPSLEKTPPGGAPHNDCDQNTSYSHYTEKTSQPPSPSPILPLYADRSTEAQGAPQGDRVGYASFLYTPMA